eukprot:gnl/TRDRNA2_/TRDRNA2_187870_c0_seq1.p1 gnl/TRDRNA2_/TRDRNA2_187870_c0~~gnl/TRDRNA2_/TRDRNA2_187870_c0_seq1.p1  ORF type:complete len:691 (+),score=103.93 gnl/TRDRNA2_/TRDRNA2_187870_c0_seq1:153-2225(+)
MPAASLIALLAIAVQVCAQDSMPNSVDKLIDRAFAKWSPTNIDVEHTTVAKARAPLQLFSSPFVAPHSAIATPRFPLRVSHSLPMFHDPPTPPPLTGDVDRRVKRRSTRERGRRPIDKIPERLPEKKALTVAEKLKQIRKARNLTLPRAPNLRNKLVERDGTKAPLMLRPYQKQMVVHLVNMKRFVVGDDCGLGKTLESIAALCQLWRKDTDMKAVVLCKKSSILQWYKEFKKFTKGIQVFVAMGKSSERRKAHALWEEATGPSVLIQGYSSACRDLGHLQHSARYSLILDDCSVIKNPNTKVHKACCVYASRASRCWGLTATLIKNNLVEGYGIYQVVVPHLFTVSKEDFMYQYCQIREQTVAYGKQIPIIVGYRQSDIEQFRKVIDDYYLGRPKHLVAQDLPVLTTRIIDVGMTQFQSRAYEEALEGLVNLGAKGRQKTTKLTTLIYAQEIVNHPALIGHPNEGSEKLDTLLDMVTDGGDLHDEKVIVFTRFVEMVNTAMPVFEKAGIECVRITGEETGKYRQAAIDAFQSPDDPTRVIFITNAGGDGINLQAAKAIVFYDIPWSAGDYLQIVGRMIRIGSAHETVYAIHLICRNTIDDHVQQVVRKKMNLIEQVLGERVKRTDGEDEFLDAGSEMNEIYNALVKDANEIDADDKMSEEEVLAAASFGSVPLSATSMGSPQPARAARK